MGRSEIHNSIIESIFVREELKNIADRLPEDSRRWRTLGLKQKETIELIKFFLSFKKCCHSVVSFR